MKRIFLFLVVMSSFAHPVLSANVVPCEDLLDKIRTKEVTAKLSDVEKAAVADLKEKGIERCNADDDKRADDFFNQALAILNN
ncbi:MAG: hypothetical protein AB7F76_03630 [Parvibaculaceae bacterium]